MGNEWDGLDEAIDDLTVIFDSVRVTTPRLIDKTMDRLVRQTKAMLTQGQHAAGTKTGSVAPAPPWRISGALVRSVKKDKVRKVSEFRWTSQAGPTRETPYPRIQELGGRTGRGHRTVLPARPYLKPAWRIVRVTTSRQFARGWQQAIRDVL